MTTPRTVTAAWLKENNACADEYDLFCKEWPGGCEATHDNLLRAAAIGLNLEWFAKRVLPPQVYDELQSQRDTLYADYAARRAALYDDYEAGRLFASYEELSAPLYGDYLSNRCALLIPALLNHFAALPAGNAAGGN